MTTFPQTFIITHSVNDDPTIEFMASPFMIFWYAWNAKLRMSGKPEIMHGEAQRLWQLLHEA